MKALHLLIVILFACTEHAKSSPIDDNEIPLDSISESELNDVEKDVAVQSSNVNEQMLDDNLKLDAIDMLLIEKVFNGEGEGELNDGGSAASSEDEEEGDLDMWEKMFGIEIPICAQYAEVTYPLHVSHLTDCGKFYKCSNGRGYLFDCPADEHWSVKFDRCDYPDMAGCTIDGTHQFKLQKQVKHKPASDNDNDESSDEDDDEDDSSSDEMVDPRCEGSDSFKSVHFSHTSDCTKYYKCYMGKAFVMKCPKGQNWSQRLNRCDHPSLARCTLIKNADDESFHSILTDPDYKIPDERCETNGFIDRSHPIQFAHPSECQMFYKCYNGLAYKVECPGGLHFNVKKQECDYPHVAMCSTSAAPQTE